MLVHVSPQVPHKQGISNKKDEALKAPQDHKKYHRAPSAYDADTAYDIRAMLQSGLGDPSEAN